MCGEVDPSLCLCLSLGCLYCTVWPSAGTSAQRACLVWTAKHVGLVSRWAFLSTDRFWSNSMYSLCEIFLTLAPVQVPATFGWPSVENCQPTMPKSYIHSRQWHTWWFVANAKRPRGSVESSVPFMYSRRFSNSEHHLFPLIMCFNCLTQTILVICHTYHSPSAYRSCHEPVL